jgi:hypothetical protein
MRLIICEHYTETECKLATSLAGTTCPSNIKACEKCLLTDNPRGKNKVTAGVAYANALKSGLNPDPSLLLNLGVAPANGPGTELKKLISWFYSPDKKKCKCATRIQKMNKWGPDKCEQKMETILRWLRHSAAIAKMPYFRPAVLLLVRKAIKNSRSQLQQHQERTARLPTVSLQSKPVDGNQ